MALLSVGANVPQQVAGTGAAYVLRPDTSYARTLEAGQRARDSAKRYTDGLKYKEAQQAAKEYKDILDANVETGRQFQDAFSEQVVPEFQRQSTAIYNPANGLTSYQRMTQAAPLTAGVTRERVLGIKKGKYLDDYMNALRKDPTRNFDGANELMQLSLRGQKDNRRLKASEYDELAAVRNFDNDLRTYIPSQVVLASMKGLFSKDYSQTADAGVVGGKHFNDVLESYLVKRDANNQPVKNADGSYALDTQKYLDATDRPGTPLNIVLNGLEKQYNERRAAGELGEDGKPLPPMSRIGHYNMLVAPLAKVNYRHQEGLNAQPKSSGSKSGSAMYGDPKAVSAGFDGAEYTTEGPTAAANSLTAPSVAVPGAPSFDNGLGLARQTFAPTQQPATRVYSSLKGEVPAYAKKPGEQGKPYVFDKGLSVADVILPDAGGQLKRNRNNSTPIFGSFGAPQALPMNPKTGEIIFPTGANEQEAAANEKRYYDQGYVPQMVVGVNTAANKNYERDRQRYVSEITARENAKAAKDDNYTPKTRGEIEDEAAKLATGGVVQGYIPYNANSARSIDPLSRGYYREWYKTHVQPRAAKARAAAPAAKPNRLNFPAAKPAATTKSTTKSGNNPLGF